MARRRPRTATSSASMPDDDGNHMRRPSARMRRRHHRSLSERPQLRRRRRSTSFASNRTARPCLPAAARPTARWRWSFAARVVAQAKADAGRQLRHDATSFEAGRLRTEPARRAGRGDKRIQAERRRIRAGLEETAGRRRAGGAGARATDAALGAAPGFRSSDEAAICAAHREAAGRRVSTVDEARHPIGPSWRTAPGLFASGVAPPGTDVRVYLNNSRVADVAAAAAGAWTVTVRKGLAAGHYAVRADSLKPDRSVGARVEVPFDVPSSPISGTADSARQGPSHPAAKLADAGTRTDTSGRREVRAQTVSGASFRLMPCSTISTPNWSRAATTCGA